MNTEISTSNPTPPDGLTPTQVPLGISGTTSEILGPPNIIYKQPVAFNLNESIYYGQFTIDNTLSTGSRVFQWDSFYPLGNFPNVYNSGESNGRYTYCVPWSLLTAFYSKQCKVDWLMNFTFIKVPDCRVSLDLIFNYNGETKVLYTPELLGSDSYHVIIDSQDDNFSFELPQFWLTNNVQTDSAAVIFSSTGQTIQPAFLPTTHLDIFIRNPYQPNMLQPDSFQVIVTMQPIVRSTVGFAAKSLTRTAAPYNPSVNRPYFLRNQFPT